jgi:hypothetical protein
MIIGDSFNSVSIIKVFFSKEENHFINDDQFTQKIQQKSQ